METVCVVVLSYNRPRMLEECLKSIHDADELIISDDGSDFDIDTVVKKSQPDAKIIHIHKYDGDISFESRVNTPRLGKHLNLAIQDSVCSIITYLCDDDLYESEWIPNVRTWFENHPEDHWVRGAWCQFKDGQEEPNIYRGWPSGFGITTGNFAHRHICSTGCGTWWSERCVTDHDYNFVIKNLDDIHKNLPFNMPKIDGVTAGHRRLHHNNQIHLVDSGEYTTEGKIRRIEMMKKGMLE